MRIYNNRRRKKTITHFLSLNKKISQTLALKIQELINKDFIIGKNIGLHNKTTSKYIYIYLAVCVHYCFSGSSCDIASPKVMSVWQFRSWTSVLFGLPRIRSVMS